MREYENNLFNNIRKSTDEIEFTLYQPRPWFKKTNKLKIFLQYLIQLIFKRNFKLYHFLDHSLLFVSPFLINKKILTTVHDLIPIVNAKKIKQKKSLFYNNFNFFLKRNSSLIARSKSTKKDLINYSNFNSKNIEVIYNGLSKIYKKINKKEIKKKYSFFLNTKKVIVFLNPFYKNNLFSLKVIKKYEEVYKENLDLICIGNRYNLFNETLRNFNLKSKVLFFKNSSNIKINELYNLSDCLLFPSINEGFGAPPIEAMKTGLPVMCSKIDIFSETIGWAYPLFKININSFTKNLRLILHNTKTKKKMIALGYKISQKYTMEVQINKHLELYKKLVK